MRPLFWLKPVAAALAVLAAVAWHRHSRLASSEASTRPHVVLVGASIGQAWKLAGWPERMRNTAFTTESVAAWQFDKGQAVAELLMRPATPFRLGRSYFVSLLYPPKRPALVILKECSAYFPGDLPAYRNEVGAWARQLRERGTAVALATVVPVTKARAGGNPGKQAAIVEFNRWLREHASEEHIPLIDLEAALRSDSETRFLREDLAAADGSHLNARAYAILDTLLAEFLRHTPLPL